MTNKLFGVIYKLTVLVQESSFYNKCYIGKRKCKNIDDFQQSSYFGSGKLITRIVNKYDIYRIKREIIYCMFDNDIQTEKEKEKQLIYFEKHFIKLNNTLYPQGLNQNIGGWGGNTLSFLTEEEKSKHKIKIKDALTGRKRTQKECNNISKGKTEYYKTHKGTLFGIKKSKEWLKKIGVGNTGKKRTKENIKKWKDGYKQYCKNTGGYWKNKQRSQADKDKISKTLSGRTVPYKEKKCINCNKIFLSRSGSEKYCNVCKNICLKSRKTNYYLQQKNEQ